MNTQDTTVTEPSLLVCSIPFITLIGLLAFTITIFGADSLSGPSQIALLASTAVCVMLGMGCCHVRWRDIEAGIEEKVRSTTVSIYILLVIGMLSASWMISGIVPTLICYGIEVIQPSFFLVSACVVSAVVSVMTGSSWTTIATIGVALLGIGRALGFDDGWTAGAIISGAYFGDKVSPLSDTTVLASSVSGTPLFKHIRYMMFTTTPTISITLIIYLVAGIFISDGNATDTSLFVNALNSTFCITPWVLLVPLLTGCLIYKKVPSLIVLFLSSVMAIVMTLIFQRHVLSQIVSAELTPVTIFEGVVRTLCSSTSIDTGVPLLNDLVSTNGMAGMLNTIWLILAAMMFGGAMTTTGMLRCLLKALLSRLVKTRLGLVFATISNGVAMNIMTGDQYISIILTANMFGDEYKRQGYESCLLSRSTEDSATVTSVLIPWNTCGMTQATVLGVATIAYMPYTFFCYLSPLMSLLHAAMGWKIKKNVAA